MKIALIGYGYWGKIVYQYLKNNNYFELVRIYDKKEKNNDSLFTNNLDTIMKDSKIEALYIASPVSTHFNIIKNGVENNKYIFCEKEICNKKEDLEYIKNNFLDKIIETNYIYTDSPSINYIKKNLEFFGEIKYIEGEISQFGSFYDDSNVYSTIGCHLLSSLMYIFNTNNIEVSFKNLVKNGVLTLKGKISGKINNIPFNLSVDLLNNQKKRSITLYGKNRIVYFNPLSENSLKILEFDYLNNIIQSEKIINFDEKNNINLALKRFKNVIEKKKRTNFEMSLKISELLLKSEEKYERQNL